MTDQDLRNKIGKFVYIVQTGDSVWKISKVKVLHAAMDSNGIIIYNDLKYQFSFDTIALLVQWINKNIVNLPTV